MDNFDLRKYLAEGRLHEKMSYGDMEKMVTPFLDLAKSKGWVWNGEGDSWFEINVPQIALYHSTELPTKKDGTFKGQPKKPTDASVVQSTVNTYRGEMENKQADVVMIANYRLGDVRFHSKDKAILDIITKTMANNTEVIEGPKERTGHFLSSKDFEPVKWFEMTLRKK